MGYKAIIKDCEDPKFEAVFFMRSKNKDTAKNEAYKTAVLHYNERQYTLYVDKIERIKISIS